MVVLNIISTRIFLGILCSYTAVEHHYGLIMFRKSCSYCDRLCNTLIKKKLLLIVINVELYSRREISEMIIELSMTFVKYSFPIKHVNIILIKYNVTNSVRGQNDLFISLYLTKCL